MLAVASSILMSSPFHSQSYIADSDGREGGGKGWQILTKQNFSSQIRLHPYVLLMVTLPWCGESRSLMKELAHMDTDQQDKFGTLKLMYVHKNSEKMLADALGASGRVTIIYYHHSVSYKYQGRLRAQNILSSVYSLMPVSANELPLKSIYSQEEFNLFLESTDKAIVLFEFCEWTSRLLGKGSRNGTENASTLQGGLFGRVFNGETKMTSTLRGQKSQKVAEQAMQNEKISCGVENGLKEEFCCVNNTDPFLESENIKPGVGLSCTLEEFKKFESFFSEFITSAQEFFLPSERQRYGLISDSSLLSSLGVNDSGSWLLMVYFAGCPTCFKVLREGDDLKSFLLMHNPLMKELEAACNDDEPDLPGNMPSVLLFMDRSSELLEVRRKSKDTFDIYREVALQNQILSQLPEKLPGDSYQGSKATSQHPSLDLSAITRRKILKDKLSLMILNDGGHVSLDNMPSGLQGQSLQDVLTYILDHKKEEKFSSLAKEVGFQLLSDDFDIKLADASPSSSSEAEVVRLNQVESSINSDKHQLPHFADISSEFVPSSHSNEEKAINVDKSHESAVGEDIILEEYSSLRVKSKEQKFHFQGYKLSFFFSDGNYRLLRSLTGGFRIPSLVIVDPFVQKHYVFPDESDFSYISVSNFLGSFGNGSLLPFEQSEHVIHSRREATRPPFVNLDFHEADSIPRVTACTFSEMVLGFNKSDSEAENYGLAWKEDVLVLFSNGWCGFCQRMELVIREVYRAFKGYRNLLTSHSRSGESAFNCDYLKDTSHAALKLPLIYLLDCTLNDCSLILKSMSQRDLYPALMLFPAEKKKPILYEGDMAVTDVIEFMAIHGKNSRHLIKEKGILSTEAERGGKAHYIITDPPPTGTHGEVSDSKGKYHQVLLKNRTPIRAVGDNRIKSQKPKPLHRAAAPVVVGSILIATDKLLTVNPFDNSKVLIINVDQLVGIQGLIINKQISWESFQALEEGLELLKVAPLAFGGPLIRSGMPLLSLTRRVSVNQYPEILPGVYFLDQAATAKEIQRLKTGNETVNDYWFFVGYSSWSSEQLSDEIAAGAWNISDDNRGMLEWP